MSAKNLFRSFLCILTAVSSITLPVYAKEETDVLNTVQRDEVHVETEETDVPLYNIEIFTSEGEGGWYDYVYQNEEISFLPGMSWDEENHVLSITDLNQPKWQLYFSCEGYEDEPVRLNIHGENVICAMETDIPMEVSGEGSLTTGYVIASYFVMNSGTLNLKSELLKEYYINYNENEDMGIGSAIYNKANGSGAHYRFNQCTVNISGIYQRGIYLYGGNLEIWNSDINIHIPKYGNVGILTAYDMNDPTLGGSLTVNNSNISILCSKKECLLIYCNGFTDAMLNLHYYTGKDTGQKKITQDEAFVIDQYADYPMEVYRYEGDFPGQNYFMISKRELFGDVSDPSRYFFEPVYWANDHKPPITTGTDRLHFSPDVNVTRGQMVTFLYRMAGTPEVESGRIFDDVDQSRYYAAAIAWAAEKGITTGYYGTNNFGPDDFCTREQIVTFLWRYAETPAPVNPASFTDAKEGAYYLDALSWAAENGITVGLNDGTGRFGVGQSCTRGMCVTFLQRYSKKRS